MGVCLEKTEADIIAFLKAQAESNWESSEQPLLLSQAAPGMKAVGLNYQAILGYERLKSFVKRTEADGGYRLVAHPTQKPKVGIVPAGVEFDFSIDELPDGGAAYIKNPVDKVREYSPRDIIRALSRLSDEELDQIVIPTRIFVKLLGGR